MVRLIHSVVSKSAAQDYRGFPLRSCDPPNGIPTCNRVSAADKLVQPARPAWTHSSRLNKNAEASGVYWLTGMKEMMEDPIPGTWNITFMNEWGSVRDARLPDGDPVRLD